MIVLEPYGQIITIPTPWGPVVYEKPPKVKLPAPPPPAPPVEAPPSPLAAWLPYILIALGGVIVYFIVTRR